MGFVFVILMNALCVWVFATDGQPFLAGFHAGLGLSCTTVRVAWWWADRKQLAREEEGKS